MNAYYLEKEPVVVATKYPKLVTAMHQIEITSRCNLVCRYCPSPKLKRPKVDMDLATYKRALEWATFYVSRGTMQELNLAGIGESTMHPDFVEYVRLARDAVGSHTRIVLATNGLLVTDEMAEAVQVYNPRFYVSLHRPEKAGPAIEILKRYGLIDGVSGDPSYAAIEWAGQVEWFTSAAQGQTCDWMLNGWMMAMADGRLTTCCLDASGVGVIGHVDDPIGKAEIKPYELCQKCHLVVP